MCHYGNPHIGSIGVEEIHIVVNMDKKGFDKTSVKIKRLVLKCCSAITPNQGMLPTIMVANSNHFVMICSQSDIVHEQTTWKNSQTSTVLKCLHGKLYNMFHTAWLEGKNDLDTADMEQFIIDTAWSVCPTHYTVLGSSTGSAVFGQGILLDLSYLVDLKAIRCRHQWLVNDANDEDNAKHIDHDHDRL